MGRVYKRGKSWYCDYRDASGKRIQRRASTDKTKAQQLLSTAEAKVAAVKLGVASPDAQIEDAELAKVKGAYLAHLRLHRRPKTAKRAEGALTTILDALGATRVSHLNVQSLERYQNHRRQTSSERTGRPVSKRTCNIETGAIRGMLNWATEARMIRENPLARLKPLRQDREEKKHRRALRPAEARKLIQVAREHHPRYADLFLCAMHTGMRRGELIALKWTDVDFSGQEIVIRGEVAKNHNRRRIPLTEELRTRLQALRAARGAPGELKPLLASLARRERRKGRRSDPQAVETEARALLESGRERVFVTGYGTPMGNNLNRILAKCVKKAGIDARGVDVHALRYTFGSWLMRKGVNIKLVSRLMGHASVQLTLDIYTDEGIWDWHGEVAKLPTLEAETSPKSDAEVTSSPEGAQAKVS